MSARRNSLLRSTSGAVAPTVALSLFGLIAAGGIAFDYARMAGLDTELQSAADQAALAAASQLDGTSSAMTRATSAAQGLVVNLTRFANDGSADGRTVKVPTTNLTFYSVYDPGTDTGTVTTTATAARFVQVSVATREAVYALTPVVQMFRSGAIGGLATAGVGSAVCKVPPMMLCIPPENAASFPTSSDIGRGLRLQPGAQNEFLFPGNWGYLRLGKGGANELAQRIGQNNQGCDDTSEEGIQTEPGDKASVPEYLNTRFDLYKNSKSICEGSGNFCPDENVGKDFARLEEIVVTVKKGDPPPSNPGCGNASAAVGDFVQNAAAKGFTRDTCHFDDTCPGKNFGNGVWDVAGYFSVNHPTDLVPTGVAATRYSVYKWELMNKANRLPPRLVSSESSLKEKGANVDYTFKNQCSYSQSKIGIPVVNSSAQKDRRILTVAAVDCSNLPKNGGRMPIKVQKWVDVFLVEPSEKRTAPYSTTKDEIYGEIVGPATTPGGEYAFQYYGRNRPYLLK